MTRLLPLAALLFSCTLSAAPELTATQQTQLQLHIMSGEMAAGRDQPEAAAREFLAALKLSPDPELAKRATVLALSGEDEKLAADCARRWHELAPNEMDPREVIASLAVRRGDSTEALTHAQAIVSGHAGGLTEGLRHVAQLLAEGGKPAAKAALQVMAELVKTYPKESAALQAQAIVAVRFEDYVLAETAARQAQTMSPDSREIGLLLGGVLVRAGKLSEADALFEPLIAKDAKPAELRLGYARLLLDAKQREAARAELRQLLKDAPKDEDAAYALAVMALTDRNAAEAEGLLLPLLEGERKQEAAYQLGRAAELRKDLPMALEYYARVTEGNLAVEASGRRAYVLAEQGKLPEARKLLTQLRELLPQYESRLLLTEADVLTQAKAYTEALALLDAAQKEDPDNVDVRYGRSLVFERQGNIVKAEAELRVILKAEPDESRALNALGYLLTVHTRKFDEAHQLIARALELDPDDAAVMDSYGWVLFKQGKKKEALDWLARAHQLLPDPEISAHYGEALWVSGDKTAARSIWEAAQKDDPDHSVLKETVQRLLR